MARGATLGDDHVPSLILGTRRLIRPGEPEAAVPGAARNRAGGVSPCKTRWVEGQGASRES